MAQVLADLRGIPDGRVTVGPVRSDRADLVRWCLPTLCPNSGKVQSGHMVLEGNAISCDAFGCLNHDDFVGDLTPEDILTRYHVLGWNIGEAGGRTVHYCPDHG